MHVTKEQIETAESIIRRAFPDAALIQFNLQIDITKHHMVSLWACCVRFKDRPGFETEPREDLLDAVNAALDAKDRPQATAEKPYVELCNN